MVTLVSHWRMSSILIWEIEPLTSDTCKISFRKLYNKLHLLICGKIMQKHLKSQLGGCQSRRLSKPRKRTVLTMWLHLNERGVKQSKEQTDDLKWLIEKPEQPGFHSPDRDMNFLILRKIPQFFQEFGLFLEVHSGCYLTWACCAHGFAMHLELHPGFLLPLYTTIESAPPASNGPPILQLPPVLSLSCWGGEGLGHRAAAPGEEAQL